MRVVVTGAAGFIGSHLVDRLLADGHDVLGVDVFRDYYDTSEKWRNLTSARSHRNFELSTVDLSSADVSEVVAGADVVFHLAAQPGVRHSWSDFERYEIDNVLATQHLLEAVRSQALRRFVYASSSSVYGNAPRYPTTEDDLPSPHSPYGVTKLAGEHLCSLYAHNWGVPAISLRYFTVYGPRQRPDMALRRLIDAAIHGSNFTLFGDGSQERDFTYVDDVVAANLAAAECDGTPGSTFNIAGDGSVTMLELISTVESAIGRPIRIEHGPAAAGDVKRTAGSTARAAKILDWRPTVATTEGVTRQVEWQTGASGEIKDR